ncbi:MAG: hypothetical protein FWD35_02600, partial [Oscillospiraceae bacterium]|nr:hypothetical protein [Oscillospiraceae bacterium]
LITFGDYSNALEVPCALFNSTNYCTACNPTDVPTPPESFGDGVAQFIEYLEASGLEWSHQLDDSRDLMNPDDDFTTPIGRTHFFTIAENEYAIRLDEYYTEERALEVFAQREFGYNDHSTQVLCGSVIINHFGNDPDVIAFLQQHYDNVIVTGCTCLVCQMNEATDEIEIVSLHARNILDGLTPFTDINDVDLYRLLWFYGVSNSYHGEANDVFWGDEVIPGRHNYTPEELEELLGFDPGLVSGHGITPALLEKLIREQLNPDFRIASYDYKSNDNHTVWDEGISGTMWDAKRGMIVQFRYPSCAIPFDSYRIEVEDVRKVSSNEYHVYALRFADNSGSLYNADSVRAVFVKNSDGSFRVTSVTPETSHSPRWLVDYMETHDKFESNPASALAYVEKYHDELSWLFYCDNCSQMCESCIQWNWLYVLQAMFSEAHKEHRGFDW